MIDQLLRQAADDQAFCDHGFGDCGGCYDIGYQSGWIVWLLQPDPDSDPSLENVRQTHRTIIAKHYLAWRENIPPQSIRAENQWNLENLL